MNQGIDYSLPDRNKGKDNRRHEYLLILMSVILIAVLAGIILLITGYAPKGASHSAASPGKDDVKAIALKMEKQGLTDSAARAWKEYISFAPLTREEKAQIWYRIGRMYQEGSEFEKALEAYYISEAWASSGDIVPEMGIRIQECLESLGKFAALNYELKDRVDLKGTENGMTDPVVAEIGREKIRKSDIDARIEKIIETSLSRMAPYVSSEQLKVEKERLLKQYSVDSQRRSFVEQYIAQELLYRQARETGVANDPRVRDEIREREKALLAGKALENEYRDQIKITLADVRSYFEANREKYTEEDGKEPEFENLKDQVALELRTRKEREVQQRLLSNLKEKHGAVIHNSALTNDSDEE